MDDQDIMDSQQGVSLEDITNRFHLLQHHVDRLPSLTSDTDTVVDMIRKGMSHASNVATDLEELGDSSMLASLEDALKESIDLEYTIHQHKAAFMKLRDDVVQRQLDVASRRRRIRRGGQDNHGGVFLFIRAMGLISSMLTLIKTCNSTRPGRTRTSTTNTKSMRNSSSSFG